MSARILSGKEIAESIKSEAAAEVERLHADHGFAPCLAVVRVGDDPASSVYVGNKVKTSEAIGIVSEHHHLPETATHEGLVRVVSDLIRAMTLTVSLCNCRCQSRSTTARFSN